MSFIQSVKIHNFRAIDEMEFFPKSINIFVGPNNSGKTSVLEAITLNMSMRSNFSDSMGNNIWEYFTQNREYNPRFLIHNKETTGQITCKIKQNHSEMHLDYINSGAPNSEIEEYLAKYFDAQFTKFINSREIRNRFFRDFETHSYKSEDPLKKQSNLLDYATQTPDSILKISEPRTYKQARRNSFIRKAIQGIESKEYEPIFIEELFEKITQSMRHEFENKLYKTNKLVFSLKENNTIEQCYLILHGLEIESSEEETFFLRYYLDNKEYAAIKISGNEVIPNRFLTLFSSLNLNQLDIYHDKLIRNNKLYEVIDLLKKRIKYFKDIRKTEDGLQIFLENNQFPIPISSMGDGFISLVTLTFISSMLDEGTILIEEPETSLHPLFIDVFSEGVIQNSEKIQFFLSTHSSDFIESILKFGEDVDKLEEIQIIRCYRREDVNEFQYEVIQGYDALQEINTIKTDLRGS